MKKIYRVREFFINSKLGPKFAGEYFPEHLIKYLTFAEKQKLDEQEFSDKFSVFGYGLVFYSTEEEFPEEIPDETYDEMVCRAWNEMNNCCVEGSDKTFLKNKENNGETN